MMPPSVNGANMTKDALQKRFANREYERIAELLNEAEAAVRLRLAQAREREQQLHAQLCDLTLKHEDLTRKHERVVRSTSYRIILLLRKPFIGLRQFLRSLRKAGRKIESVRLPRQPSKPFATESQQRDHEIGALVTSDKRPTAADSSAKINASPAYPAPVEERENVRLATGAHISCLKAPTMQRETAVFVTHSSDGYLKPHVLHYVAMLKGCGIEVTVVVASDSALKENDPEFLTLLNGLFVRENEGFDFAAWAHVLTRHPVYYECDALYLLNDSLFGPTNVVAFQALLKRVRNSDADLVGLTDNYEIAWHIQSYFLVLKQRALASTAFRDFISRVESHSDKDQVIKEYEISFAPMLQAAGLKCQVLFCSDDLVNPTIFGWKRLLRSGFPFIKVMTIRETFVGVDKSCWRTVLADEGYDGSLAERTLLINSLQKVGRL